MSEFQAIIDFCIQINKFVNVDLFQRGFYQIRTSLKLSNCKLPNKVEINPSSTNISFEGITPSNSSNSLSFYSFDSGKNSIDSNSNIVFPPCVINGTAVSKTFQIIYKNEEVSLNDTVSYRVSICLDSTECLKQIQKTNFVLQVELWFTDQECLSNQHQSIECVSARQLLIHFDLCRGIHYNLPVIFDYFHLSAVTISIHGSLVTICQPYIYKNEPTFWLTSVLKDDNNKKNVTSNGNTLAIQIRRLQLTQWKLVSIIASAILTLRRKINEFYRLLPPWQQAKINFESLFTDVSMNNLNIVSQECFKDLDKMENQSNLSSLIVNFQNNFENKFNSTETDNVSVEEMLTTIEHDIAYICGLTIDQWQRFLRLVTFSERINQHLAKIHHLQRIKRFAEGFFCIEHPRTNLNTICDQISIPFLEISDSIRKSSYFTHLPPCDVECVQLDGDAATLPIIYEEKYEPPDDGKAKDSVSLPANSSLNSLGYFSSPSKHSLSSSSTSSSNSSKSNIKYLFSRLNNIVVNEKPSKRQMYSPSQVQNSKSQVNKIDFLGLYSNELFKDDDLNHVDYMNKRIKLINTLINKKNIIKSCSKLSLDYSDKRMKKLAKTNQYTIVNMLRNTISLEHSNITNALDANGQFERIENSRSWPNLVPELSSIRHHSADAISERSNLSRHRSLKKDSKKSSKKKDEKSLQIKELSLPGLFDISNYLNFQGTMYFPKPPKEFAMVEVDEPTEVNLKPIPHESDQEPEILENKVLLETIKMQELTLNESQPTRPTDKLKNSISCQDLVAAANGESTSAFETIVKSDSKDDSCLKSKNLNDTKFTFIELLQSDHCLICCGSIQHPRTESWRCTCKKKDCKLDSENASLPALRRISAVGSDFISFLHAKEEFRSQISAKVKNLLFYSDFHSLASRIPYFQCDSDFRAFNSHRDLHLIVCVHGLDGNSADLRLVKTYLELGLPTNNFDFLMSKRNQGETFDSLETLTSRLINEIDNYVASYNLKPARLSFIGHSLGNIIIRAAISRHDFIKRWRDKLYTFLSLSGPHLGLAYNRSGLVNMGLWFIQKFKKAPSLTQLSMKDSNDIRQTYLYQLSAMPGLEHFHNILLCGSSQDYYVPIHSAHIELCNAAVGDNSENGIAYREMASNILQRLSNKPSLNIVRYDVHHALSSNANSLIGRAAHIAVLDSELFIEKFMVVVGLKYFM